MFLAALLKIAKLGSSQSPSVGEWINKLVYPDDGILMLRRNELSNHEKTCKKVKYIL